MTSQQRALIIGEALIDIVERDGHVIGEHVGGSPLNVAVCSPGDALEDLLVVMTERRVRHLPVVADGGLVGLVSIGDLVKHRLDEKELEANVLLEISRLHA